MCGLLIGRPDLAGACVGRGFVDAAEVGVGRADRILGRAVGHPPPASGSPSGVVLGAGLRLANY
ncbi:hypothetical protein Nans01_06260 [Nocardiopsis ansamitocini]|uniref:Uncharacterized protein n=1 Tax=Nocardiopsis ansamitocini TaxID=1670832 RepID=A0A9W6P2Y9_9ACTN|nr:hypothetical protein Nans01_06260 [Nocardiopsis ansamitocini]